MAQLGSGYGTSTQQGLYGATEGAYDSGAAMQQRLAQEQWDWQKKIYGQQQGLAGQMGEGLSGMVSQYNQAYGEAKTANEQRYQQMLGIADQTTGQRQADITSAYGQKSSGIMQRLAKLGMANTTVAPTMQMGVDREREAALDRSADQMQQTKLGIMERRTDEYPKSDIIMQLAQALGQGGGAGGMSALSALTGMRTG